MGRRFQKPNKNAQALLLHFLWCKHGGPVNVSRLCGVGMQAPNNWRIRGQVPMPMLKRVSVGIGESMWALNYAGMAQLYDKADRPSWIDVVDGCKLDRSSRNDVVFLKPPVVRD